MRRGWLDTYPYLDKRGMYKMLQEVIGPQKEWPFKLRKLIFGTKHWKNQERFIVTVFLLNNGCDPRMIRSLMLKKSRYDIPAQAQVDYVIKAYPRRQWTAWNVALRRST